jgi:NADH-quinone oxidoreductase subunit C
METQELVQRVEQAFGNSVKSAADEGPFPHVLIELDELKNVLSFCAHDAALRFDFLECITAVDTGQDIMVIYHLFSSTYWHRLSVKTAVDRHAAKLPSATVFWRAAFAYELEVAEMFGLTFEGHPAPAHLLLPEDWHGYPLRKDYVFPEEYHGIEHRRGPLRKEHPRP